MAGTVHIIGAGLSGLAAAVRLSLAGQAVRIHEMADHAGGRCRSFHDTVLDRFIDNGNHLILTGNTAVREHLSDIGNEGALTGPDRAAYPFVDLQTGDRWTVKPDAGRIPWSVLTARGRAPGVGLMDYLRSIKIARAKPEDTVGDLLRDMPLLMKRFWEPMALGVLNTPVDDASAQLLWRVLEETFCKGEAACRPLFARQGLGPALIDPAVTTIERMGGQVDFGRRLKVIDVSDKRVLGLVFGRDKVDLSPRDHVVLAVPAWAAKGVVPGVEVPETSYPIVNAHYVLPTGKASQFDDETIIGLVGSVGQWIFLRGDVASVTISGAVSESSMNSETLASLLWREVAQVLGLDHQTPLPTHRIIKEKRATIGQSPSDISRRPPARTPYVNLVLAGDWTDTGLPATIEGSLRSGHMAATCVLSQLGHA